jgi:hypothetical protein
MDWRKIARLEKEPALSTTQKVLLAGAVALVVQPAIRILSHKLKRTQADAAKLENSVDKTLKDTFPASDPPASHYYDIPVNRQ